MLQQVNGMAFRSLAYQFQVSVGGAYTTVASQLNELPHCTEVTRQYCNRFCGVLLVDGKYITVKGYNRKIPVLYGIDYTTHDIPTYLFSIGENYQTCLKFFKSLKLLKYPLQAIVSDDTINIYQACTAMYPEAVIQLCLNHYEETIRGNLAVGTDPTYRSFMYEIEQLFKQRRAEGEFVTIASKITQKYGGDPRCMSVMIDIHRRMHMLCAYMRHHHIPRTNNLIESFNSHLEGRLRSIKGFHSFQHADTWLNAYFLHRRLKPFTDCEGRFRSLNGFCSLQKSIKDVTKTPQLLSLFR